MGKRSSAVRDCEDLATMLENTPVLDRRIEEAQKETDLYAEQNRALIRERAATGMSDEEYDKRVIVVKQHHTAAEARLAKLTAEKASRQARSKEIRRFLEKLKGQPTVREGWDEQAWNLLAACVPVCPTMTPETFAILKSIRRPVWVTSAYIDHTLYRHKYLVDAVMHMRDNGNANARLTLFSPEELEKYDIAITPDLPYPRLFGENHASWVPTYCNEYGVMSWLLNQVRDL